MNKYVEQLIELSNINKEIEAFEPQLAKIAQTLELALEKVASTEQQIATLEDEIKELKIKRAKNELHISEISEKLSTIGKKQASVKTEKEAKALQLEEEIAKEQLDFANEEIVRFDKVISQKTDEIKSTKEELANLAKSTEELDISLNKEKETIEKDMAKVYDKKNKLIAKMSQKILTFYEKIRKWAKSSAVVPVRKQACYGCFMKINDKTYSQVLLSEDIVTCPHCGRILYKEVEAEEA